jgi:hypothetical protein
MFDDANLPDEDFRLPPQPQQVQVQPVRKSKCQEELDKSDLAKAIGWPLEGCLSEGDTIFSIRK